MTHILFILFAFSLFFLSRFSLEKAAGPARRWLSVRKENVKKRLENDFLPFTGWTFSLFLSPLLLAALLLPFTGMSFSALLLLIPALSFFLPAGGYALYSRRRKRQAVEKIPRFLDLTIRYLAAGYSFPQVISKVEERVKGPLGDELKVITGNMEIGVPPGEAIRTLYERIPCEETMILALTFSTILERGGDMVAMAKEVRNAITLKRTGEEKMRTLTAQGRLQGIALSLVPPLLLLSMNFVMPGYLAAITGTFTGKVILGIAFSLLICGWVMIFLITRTKV